MGGAERSENLQRDAGTGGLDGIAIQRGERLVFVSDELAWGAGHDPDDLVGRDWRTLFPAAEVDRLESTGLERARADGRWEGTVRVEGASGRTSLQVALTAIDETELLWRTSHPQRAAGGDAEGAAGGGAEGVGDRDTEGVGDGATEGVGDRATDATSGRSEAFYRRPAFVRTLLDALDDILYVIDEGGESHFWNEALVETTGYSHAEIDAMQPMELIPEDQHEYVPGLMEAIDAIEDRRVEVDIRTKSGERIPHEFRGTTLMNPGTGESFRCGLARDITERKARETRLERQRDELRTLDRLNELLLETVGELTQAASRDAVERRVCERLAGSEFYRFAWVGERELDGNRLVPRVTAGEDDGYLDAVTITTDRGATGEGPAGRALRTGDVQVATVDGQRFEPWREAARERGFESVAAVPLQHRGTVYGVLIIYATRDDAFTEREQLGFDVLGRAVGAVVSATRSRELLFADRIVELEFDISGVETELGRIARDLECEFELEGYISSGDRWVVYCAVRGAAPAAVTDAVAATSRVDRSRIIGDTSESARVELVLEPPSVLHAVADAGASVRTWTTSPATARLTVQAPRTADVRTIVNEIRSAYPAARLLAQHEHEDHHAPVGRPGGLLDALTDRQRETLEAAYRAGYYGECASRYTGN